MISTRYYTFELNDYFSIFFAPTLSPVSVSIDGEGNGWITDRATQPSLQAVSPGDGWVLNDGWLLKILANISKY